MKRKDWKPARRERALELARLALAWFIIIVTIVAAAVLRHWYDYSLAKRAARDAIRETKNTR